MHHSFNVEFSLKFSKLFAESSIRLAARAFLLDYFKSIVEIPSIFLHQIGDQQSWASRNSSSTMNKDISSFPCILNPLISWEESVSSILCLAIIKVEFQMNDFLRIFEMQIYTWTHSTDIVLLQFSKIMCKIIPTYPYFAQFSFARNYLLALAVISSKWEHF